MTHEHAQDLPLFRHNGIPTYGTEPTIQEQFAQFHRENPHVYRGLVRLARIAKSEGRERYGIKALFEVLRWYDMVQTKSDEFRLNNNYTALYARLIMRREPDLKGFFELRERTAE